MDVSLPSQSGGLFVSASPSSFRSLQQLDAKLIAFCTILTVALSFIFSQSMRHSHLVPLFPFIVVLTRSLSRPAKRCFTCFKCGFNRCGSLRRLKNNLKGKVNKSTKQTRNSISSCYCYMKRRTAFSSNNNNSSSSATSSSQSSSIRRFGRIFKLTSISFSAYDYTAIWKTLNVSIAQRMNRLHGIRGGNGKNVTIIKETTTTPTNFGSPSDYEINTHIQTKKYSSKVRLYKRLPLKSLSRAWGEINSIDLPVWARKPCFLLYAWMFKCNLEEIDSDDITEFKNLSEFFRRGLKPDARTVNQHSCLISPCDGRILHFGKVSEDGYLEQVKGVTYSLQEFLGKQNWPKPYLAGSSDADESMSGKSYERSIVSNPENCLYHCVIYLAPGDYHRFHSPTDWTICARRHFPGELFSVNPNIVRWLKGVFNLNERVAYYGHWKYGFFSMTPVGATNVGSIKVYIDDDLITNCKISKSAVLPNPLVDEDKLYKNFFSPVTGGIESRRGEHFGEFNLGSTIVLIFEAPKDFEFNITQNEQVAYGRELGSALRCSTQL